MIKVISDNKNNHWINIGDNKPFMHITSQGTVIFSGDVVAFGKIPNIPKSDIVSEKIVDK